jgi:flagellar protein FlbD
MCKGGFARPKHQKRGRNMILLTKLGGKQVLINDRLMETAQETPDTVITMNNGHTYIVTEKLDVIMNKIVEFNRLSKRDESRLRRIRGGEDK